MLLKARALVEALGGTLAASSVFAGAGHWNPAAPDRGRAVPVSGPSGSAARISCGLRFPAIRSRPGRNRIQHRDRIGLRKRPFRGAQLCRAPPCRGDQIGPDAIRVISHRPQPHRKIVYLKEAL